MTMLKYVFAALLCYSSFDAVYSQSVPFTFTSEPQVGKPMPDFTLTNVEYFKTSRISLKDFQGKWLVLDFWYRGCTTCVESLPKIDVLQKTFKDRVQFIVIAVNDRVSFGNGIRSLYENLRKKQSLDLPVAYDSILKQKWTIYSFPHLIIINPNGIVKAVTTGQDLTRDKMAAMIDGRPVHLAEKDIETPSFDPAKAPAPKDLISRSVLSRWKGETQFIPNLRHAGGKKLTDVRISMAPLEALYNIAYLGTWKWIYGDSLYDKVYPRPILEVRDTTLFSFDFHTGNGLYNYGSIFTRDRCTANDVMEVLQNDLKNAFGYEAAIEERMMPVWYLIARPGAVHNLTTKHGAPGYSNNITGDGGAGGFGFTNFPVDHLLDLCTRYIYDYITPFFDATNIHDNIDITMDALMTNRAEIVKALNKNGLDLVKGEKLMKVLVIRDPGI